MAAQRYFNARCVQDKENSINDNFSIFQADEPVHNLRRMDLRKLAKRVSNDGKLPCLKE